MRETARQAGDGISPWARSAVCILLLAATSAYFFRGVWNPLNTIDGADSSLWVPMFVHKWTAGLFAPRWAPHYLAGIAQQHLFLSHDLLLALALPPHRFHGFQFMLDTFLAGAFMFAFLRSRRIGRFGSLVGGLSYQLGNNLLTTASLGGMWKFSTVCWAPLFLLFFFRVIDGAPNRLRNSVFAGATLGLQFLGGEVQLAYYVCLLALAYFAIEAMSNLWNARRERAFYAPLKAEGKRMLWGALCAVLGIVFAAEVFCSYASFARGNENVGVGSAEENWKFVTEFSFPPEETLALALTGGVFGTDAYPQTYQGRPIKRISDDYIGIVVLMFAFLALFSGGRRAWFFAGAAVIALVISYGRYFPPLFRLVYALPVMKGLRVPHKWLFITTLCVPVLAGMGADFWIKAPSAKSRRIIVATLIFFAAMIALAFASPAMVGALTRRPTPEVLARAAVLVLASAACALGRSGGIGKRKVIGAVAPLIVVVLLAADLIANASKFISYYDHRPRFNRDRLVQSMLLEPEPFRVKLWSESPHLRDVITEILPYHGIGVVDVVMSRRPARYSEVLKAAREERLPFKKLLQLFNVKYILSASAVPATTDIPLRPAPQVSSQRDRALRADGRLYEMGDYLPRVYMVDKYEVAEPGRILDVISRPDFDLRRAVALEKNPAFSAGPGSDDPKWSVREYRQTPHRVSMSATVDRPAILVMLDFMHPDWRARVDEREVEILRADYLMRAVVLPEGAHHVEFTYHPPVWGFAVTLVGWIIIILLVLRTFGARILAALRTSAGDESPEEQ